MGLLIREDAWTFWLLQAMVRKVQATCSPKECECMAGWQDRWLCVWFHFWKISHPGRRSPAGVSFTATVESTCCIGFQGGFQVHDCLAWNFAAWKLAPGDNDVTQEQFCPHPPNPNCDPPCLSWTSKTAASLLHLFSTVDDIWSSVPRTTAQGKDWEENIMCGVAESLLTPHKQLPESRTLGDPLYRPADAEETEGKTRTLRTAAHWGKCRPPFKKRRTPLDFKWSCGL